jgi:hypothetical protein
MAMMYLMQMAPDDGVQQELEKSIASDDPYVETTLCKSCSRTFSAICNVLRYKEFNLPLVVFLIVGVALPNFDDLHYVFLTEKAGMEKSTYDFLNTLTYVGIIFFTFLYLKLLKDCQVWILVEVSFSLFLLMTSLMLANATRKNIEWGISDEVINGVIFFLGTNSISVLAILPIYVVLTYLVPNNVEASTMALISATFIWAFEVGAKISSSIYCVIFDVDDDHMDNYPHILFAKIPAIIIMMILAIIIPRN